MVWAAYGVGVKPYIYVIEDNINSEVYKRKVLQRFFKEMEERDPNYLQKKWYFQQDGAKCHTSHSSI